jgi:ElaB/YqjD/DUF883 family membrane-anchored ribosome-binding protein
MTMDTTRDSPAAGLTRDPTARDPMVERAAASAHQAVDRVATSVNPAVERVRAAAQGSATTLQSKLGDFNSMQQEWTESCRTYVRERPLTALGVAVLAGFLLSRWVRNS